MLRTIQRYGLPIGYRAALLALHARPLALARTPSGEGVVLFSMDSGILQGCPLSGSLWALCMDPIVRAMDAICTCDVGILTACADDLGLLLHSLGTLPQIAQVFMDACRLARLSLAPRKCVLVPLWAPCTEEFRAQLLPHLERLVPAWVQFSIQGGQLILEAPLDHEAMPLHRIVLANATRRTTPRLVVSFI